MSRSRMKSSTRRANSCPFSEPMSVPSRFTQASFMPTRPMVEKWFFQYWPNRSCTARR